MILEALSLSYHFHAIKFLGQVIGELKLLLNHHNIALFGDREIVLKDSRIL